MEGRRVRGREGAEGGERRGVDLDICRGLHEFLVTPLCMTEPWR